MTNKVDIALEIMELFREYACNAYLVGGSIRNLLLNISIKDIESDLLVPGAISK